jgi:monoamine oxidase
VLITRWRQDPFALGSYSFLGRGAQPADRVALGEPVGRTLFFAGEAANRRYPGTVHGAYLSGQQAAEHLAETGARSVAIVGAGIAGLRAAQILAGHGVRCTILEARNRIGGRIWTNRALGPPIDLGASWIHGTRGNPLTRLADEAGAEIEETDFEAYRLYDQAGRILRWSETPESFRDVVEIEHLYGADLADLSDDAVEEGEGFGGSEVIFPGGYDQLFAVLDSPCELRPASPVTAIAYDDDGVALTVSGGRVSADAALVTVPLGVLKAGSIAFAPALPARKRAAVARLGMGLLNKVCLRFDRMFWDREAVWIGYVGPERGRFAAWLNLAPFVGQPVLVAFNSGRAAAAIEAMRDDAILAEAMAVLGAMYGAG